MAKPLRVGVAGLGVVGASLAGCCDACAATF